jgi:hypothetical protein
MGLPTFAIYAATKAAVRSFVRSWAMELAAASRPGRNGSVRDSLYMY